MRLGAKPRVDLHARCPPSSLPLTATTYTFKATTTTYSIYNHGIRTSELKLASDHVGTIAPLDSLRSV